MHPKPSKIKSDCLSCQVRDGLIAIDGRSAAYYASRNGERMLVVEMRANQRIRIDDALDVVVLEIGNGVVRLGIDQPEIV